MKIKVTHDHLVMGLPNSCLRCPIALAVSDIFPAATVSVGNDYINVFSSTYGLRSFKLPPEAKMFITRVDAGLSAEPIEFEAPEVSR